MATVESLLAELEQKGTEQTRKTFARHGISGNVFGVLVGDLKAIAKTIRGEQPLALDLFATGNYDAMYLAGLVADGSQMTKKQLEGWAKSARWPAIAEYTVPWVTVESPHARSLALKWIKSKNEQLASAGWSTYGGIVSVEQDENLDLAEIENLLDKVEAEISIASNRLRYVMNGFVIVVGSFVKPLLQKAKDTAQAIGKVDVDMGETACKVPLATEYIAKMESQNRIGKKRKTIRC